MHGLRNPLASLSQFVSGQGNGIARQKDEETQDALTAARRMQSLVEQTLEVLADARGEPAYEYKGLQPHSRFSIFCYELAATVYSKAAGWM